MVVRRIRVATCARPNERPGRRKLGTSRRVDVGGGIKLGVVSRDVSAWIPPFAENDEFRRTEGVA